MNYREFNPVRALYNFEQVYRNIPFAEFLSFPNITEEDLAQNQWREEISIVKVINWVKRYWLGERTNKGARKNVQSNIRGFIT